MLVITRLAPTSLSLLGCGQQVSSQGPGFCKTTQGYVASDCYLYPLRRNQESCDSVLWLNFSCLVAFPLFLDFLISVIINCLSLLFGTLTRPQKLQLFLQKRSGDKRELYEGGHCRVKLCFSSLFSSILLNPEGNGATTVLATSC